MNFSDRSGPEDILESFSTARTIRSSETVRSNIALAELYNRAEEPNLATWIEAATLGALHRHSPLEVEAGSAALLLYVIAGRVYATAAVCPHHAAWLSQGSVDGEHVNCPRHQGQFHIPTGQKTRGPHCPALRTYPVAVRDGVIWVDVEPCTAASASA